MRINSNFRDYYDCIQSYGQDQSVVWNRFAKVVEYDKNIFYQSDNRYFPNDTGVGILTSTVDYWRIYLGFCGKVYPVIRTLEHTYTGNIITYHYDIEEFETFRKAKVAEQKKRYVWDRRNHRQWFEKIRATDFSEVFEKHYCPVFDFRYNEDIDKFQLTVNGDIGKFDFVKIKDPFTTYQDISMFYGGLAVPQKPIPSIPDKVMVEVKGFDKYSFRKNKKEN